MALYDQEKRSKLDTAPYNPECQFFYEDGPDSKILLIECPKHKSHKTFIPVKDFEIGHLPHGCQTEEVMNTIKDMSERTVKITVDYFSCRRPDIEPYNEFKKGQRPTRRCGTGFIEYIPTVTTKDKPCPCSSCKASGHPKKEYKLVKVHTALHVVFDDFEASRAVVQLFYDSEEDRNGKIFLHGVREWNLEDNCPNDIDEMSGHLVGEDSGDTAARDITSETRCNNDVFKMMCVTHDSELIDRLSRMKSYFFNREFPTGIIISHPHGCSKHITIGHVLHYTISITSDNQRSVPFTVECGPEARCRLYVIDPTGYPKREVIGSSDSYTSQWFDDLLDESLLIQRNSSSARELVLHRKDSYKQPLLFGNPHTYKPSTNHQWSSTFKYETAKIEGDAIICIEAREYVIPEGKMIITLPADAKYVYTFRYHNNKKWVMFPLGTRFSFGNGKGSFLVPGVEFTLGNTDQSFIVDRYHPFFVTYNMDTCPGSSGAPVIFMLHNDVCPYYTGHCGALPDGTNQSGNSAYPL